MREGGGVRFQCSFRLDPLTLGGSWVGGAAGAGGLRRLGVGCRGLDGESAGGLCGSSLHSQGNSGGGLGFRAVREGGGVRFQCSFRLDPLTLGQFSVGGWIAAL